MDYLQISNLPIMWFLCSFTVIIAAVQAVLFIRAANKATKECRIDPEIPKKAFRIGLVTAIAEGDAEITVTYAVDGKTYTDFVNVEVTA